MCSHRLVDVQDVCDRIAILYNGDLQEQGKVDKLVELEQDIMGGNIFPPLGQQQA